MINSSINHDNKKDWEQYMKDFALQLWNERPKKPLVLSLLLLTQVFVVAKNDAFLKLSTVYLVAVSILFVLVVLFWIAYFRHNQGWQLFFQNMINGVKEVIENNKDLSDNEIEQKIREFHESVLNGTNEAISKEGWKKS